jgi:SNF2 family DNA or RNA helicase
MTIQLRDYQKDAVRFFNTHDRAILADEPGVGKTWPAIEAALHATPAHLPVLIVVPAYLTEQWRREIIRYCPRQVVSILHRADAPVDPLHGGVIITNFHMLMNQGLQKHPELLKMPWAALVIDEAHRLRGRNSQWTKNIVKLKSHHTWMLTGTPIVSNPGDLWPLLRICDPKRFSSYWRFVNEYCETQQTPFATEIVGLRPGIEKSFHAMLDTYLMRRSIEDHLPEIPEVIERTITVKLPPLLQKAHDRAKKDWFIAHPNLDDPIIAASGGALVTKLRQLTAGWLIPVDDAEGDADAPTHSPKVDACVEYVQDHPTEQIVVFSYFRATAALIERRFRDLGRPVLLASGAQNPTVRAEIVETWKTTPNAVMVATISALQEGANLQNAHTVCFVESSYLPSDMEQCIARVRRFGQYFPVNVIHFVAERTVDEAVVRASKKRERHIMRALLRDIRDESTDVAKSA